MKRLYFIFISLRYWSEENINHLLNTKQAWDPFNVFNHCHSVGSTTENCCPKDV